jgi:hypothetical protein
MLSFRGARCAVAHRFCSRAAGLVDMVDDGRPVHPSRQFSTVVIKRSFGSETGLRDGTAVLLQLRNRHSILTSI